MSQLVILAGGEGSRFFPFTSVVPKCLLPVAGKPCVRRIVEDARVQGITNIILCINEKDARHFRHEFRDLPVQLSVTTHPKGTAGELLASLSLLNPVDMEFILRYGDDLTQVDYKHLVNQHVALACDMTLVVTRNITLPVGTVTTTDNLLVWRFDEKPTLRDYGWTGVAVIARALLKAFLDGDDIGRDVIPRVLAQKRRVGYYDTNAAWFDVGNIDHWRRADAYFREVEP